MPTIERNVFLNSTLIRITYSLQSYMNWVIFVFQSALGILQHCIIIMSKHLQKI